MVESIGGIPSNNIVYTGLVSICVKLEDVIHAIEKNIDSYVSFQNSDSLMGGIEMTIFHENHTLGNLLSGFLQIRPEIHYCAYKMPHPLQEIIVIRIQTLSMKEGEPIEMEITKELIIKYIHELITLFTTMKQQWRESIEDNQNCLETFTEFSKATIKKLSQTVDIDDESSDYDDGSEKGSEEGSEEESDGESDGEPGDEESSTDSDNEGE